ncbi:MAG: MarR family winged helix-turn-helix transcriptional regulator [Pseudomonadota bacterium]
MRAKEEEIMIWAGVVTQLNRTRSNRLLQDSAIPYPLFVLLRHFAHDHTREWSVTGLTAAFETGQSGMTKKVQKLLALGLLDVRDDEQDGRKKWFRISTAGLEQLRRSNVKLHEDQQSIFADWASDDVQALHGLLFRLKSYLDDNRPADNS